ncbi:hypothetical protein NEMIN01_1502 [Nematocida minor]|uniref:uncharacterized protein n=1 Tax=Nematocida minor TaxID=1912983 RepID=UPI00221F36F9|nr:uncharacterized protein NEMIN01_1502 [Nematocida minor]KAI5191426.1 hypothetical protein NEMIN01_1502 [Nematocida minor]
MIIQSSILTLGKQRKFPIKYTPTRDVFEKYAHYYEKDPQELFETIEESVNLPQEYEDISSEEEEDNEIRATDRIAFSLVSDTNDVRLDTYIFDQETEAFYVHHDVFLHGVPTSLAVSDRNDNPWVFVSNEDGTIAGYRVFVTNHFLPDMVILAHESKIRNIVADTVHIVSNDKTSIKVWDINTQKNTFEIAEESATLSMNENMIYFSNNSTVYAVDMREGAKNKIFNTESEITAISSDGNTIAAGLSDGTLVFSINREKERAQKIHTDKINNLSTSQDRYIVSASRDESISLFDMQNLEIVERKQTNLETATVAIPKDTPSIYVYPTEEGELDIGSFEEAILRIE